MDTLNVRHPHTFTDHPCMETLPVTARSPLRNNTRRGHLHVAFIIFLKMGMSLLIFMHPSDFLKDLLSAWHWTSDQDSKPGNSWTCICTFLFFHSSFNISGQG